MVGSMYRNKRSNLWLIIASISGVAIISALAWAFWPINEAMTIKSFSWDRTVFIYKIETCVRESSIRPPGDARIIDSWTEIYTDGPDQNGNFSFDSETYYKYEIEEWVYSRELGGLRNGHEPFWPQFTLATSDRPYRVGEEKEYRRYERYIVHFENGNSATISQDKWDKLTIGQIVYVTKLRFGPIVDVVTLENDD